MDRVLPLFGLATTGITGDLTLTKTGTTARTYTFQDGAYTVAGLEFLNVFTVTQTIDLGTGALPAAQSGTVLRFAQANATTQRVEFFGYGSTALQATARLAAGTRAVPLYPTNGQAAHQFIMQPYDEATAGFTTSALARFIMSTTEQHTATAKGCGFQVTVTLNGAAAQTNALWLQGTTVTDPFPTLGIGAAPTAGNGLMQLAGGGTTKAYGLAFSTDCFIFKSAATSITIDASTSVTLTGGLIFTDAKDIAFGTSTGNKIGTSTSQKIGFWNKAPAVQPTATTTAGAAVATTAATNVTPFGFTTGAQADDIITQLNRSTARLNDIYTKLQTIGLIA